MFVWLQATCVQVSWVGQKLASDPLVLELEETVSCMEFWKRNPDALEEQQELLATGLLQLQPPLLPPTRPADPHSILTKAKAA